GLFIVATLGSDMRRGNPKHLKHPAELTASLEIGLEFEPAFDKLPAWVRWLAKEHQPDFDDPFGETLEAYRDVLSLPDLHPVYQDAIRGRLAVLLAEQGRWPEATAVLDSMTSSEEAQAFRATMQDAYGAGDSLVAAAPALAILSPSSPVGWKSDWT